MATIGFLSKQTDTLLTSNERTKVMELTTSWKEEGRVEGRVEGRMEATLNLVLRLLARRVGKISSAAEAKVRALEAEQLAALGEALLDFTSPSDLDTWLWRAAT